MPKLNGRSYFLESVRAVNHDKLLGWAKPVHVAVYHGKKTERQKNGKEKEKKTKIF